MKQVLGIGIIGLTIAWVVALIIGDSMSSAAELVGLAGGMALAVSLVGVVTISYLRQSPFTTLLWIGVATTILGVAVGVLIAGHAMFLSSRDTRAVVVMLIAAGTIGAATSLLLGSRMGNAIKSVPVVAGAPPIDTDVRPTALLPTRELNRLADDLWVVFKEMNVAIERERAMETSRREFVAWISHDLRTPLAGIRAMTEALQDKVVDDPETISAYHEAILLESARLTSMIEDLFRLSQIHAGLIELNLEEVSLSDLVSDALSSATPFAIESSVMLSGEVVDRDTSVQLATSEFLRVLRNLLDNAIRHTPEGGRVSVVANYSDTEAIVQVKDGCGGIPSGEIDRVFELGFRGDVARTPGDGARAGLGLAIAMGLVDAHGGSLAVENQQDGCCFTIRVPISS